MTRESVDDLTVSWSGPGGVRELVRRMLALADELDTCGDAPGAGFSIRAVLQLDRNPLPDQRPQLGRPPTRRATEPGAP